MNRKFRVAMKGNWRFESRKHAFTWCCRSSIASLIVCQVLIFIMVPAVDKRQILTSIQQKVNEVEIPVSDPPSHLSIPPPRPMRSSDLAHHDETTTTTPLITTTATTATTTNENDNMIKFPVKPLHNVYSILRQSIGTTILKTPDENPLRQCAPTVQFQLRRHRQRRALPDQDDDTAIEYTLHAMMTEPPGNNNNNSNINKRPARIIPKLMGGDELFVEWASPTDPSDRGVALITDETNGTYTLKFVRPPIYQQNYTEHRRPNHHNIETGPNEVGRLTIYYDYTCGIGSLFAPKKKHYRRAGEVHVTLVNDDVPRPFIHDFVPPNTDSQIDLSKYDTVIAFGDSLMLQFVRQFQAGGFWSHTIHYEQNINQCISNSQEAETAIQKFMEWHGPEILDATAHDQSVAVILGSAVWDAMRGCVRRDFVDHRAAIRQLITTLRTMYPQVDYYWKSPSAIVLHRHAPLEEMLVDKVWLERSKYISDGVPRHIYSVQKALMQELNVTLLDVFDAYYLSGPWTLPGDSRHYQDDISFLMLSYYWPGLNRTNLSYKQKVKTSE